MAKFRKRPVEVEAVQWKPETKEGVAEMLRFIPTPALVGDELHIKTLEGTRAARPGDWVICGVAGEFYPCKPDIFEATYAAVESNELVEIDENGNVVPVLKSTEPAEAEHSEATDLR